MVDKITKAWSKEIKENWRIPEGEVETGEQVF